MATRTPFPDSFRLADDLLTTKPAGCSAKTSLPPIRPEQVVENAANIVQLSVCQTSTLDLFTNGSRANTTPECKPVQWMFANGLKGGIKSRSLLEQAILLWSSRQSTQGLTAPPRLSCGKHAMGT